MERDRLAGRPFCPRMPVWMPWRCPAPSRCLSPWQIRLSRTDVLTYRVRLKFGIRYVHFDQVSERDDTN